MNGLDIAIAFAAIGAFVGGYRRGLLVRASSLVGLVLGVVLAGQNMQTLLDMAGPPLEDRRLPYIAGFFLLGAVLGRAGGVLFGGWFRGRMPTHTLRQADRFGGGVLGLVGVVFTVWLVVPMMAHIPGWPSESSRASAVGRVLADKVPSGPDLFGSVRRLTKGGQFPVVVNAIKRSLDSGLPPVEAPLDVTTQTLVEASIVEVSASTCGVLSDGSGFSVGDGNVVTNAHVIAGAVAISVVDSKGVVRPARVTVLDPQRDLALLSVQGYTAPALSYGVVDLGEEVGVFGHPVGGALRVAPAGIREMLDSVGRDIYDGKRTRRPVLVLSGRLEPGDSGAAVVARSGRLVGVAFAVAPDRPGTAYALPISELSAFLESAKTPTGKGIPGRCLR